MLGVEGQGFAPMQIRLGTRRVQMASWSIGMAQRALGMICEYAPQRVTFGQPLSQRGVVQGWVADAATRIHAARLMTYDCAWKLDQGREARLEISMIKAFATEMAYEVVDHAMQAHGAMGMTKELPLQFMAAKLSDHADSMTARRRSKTGSSPATCWARNGRGLIASGGGWRGRGEAHDLTQGGELSVHLLRRASGEHATVDDEILGGDEACLVGSQERRGSGDVGRQAGAGERRGGGEGVGQPRGLLVRFRRASARSALAKIGVTITPGEMVLKRDPFHRGPRRRSSSIVRITGLGGARVRAVAGA